MGIFACQDKRSFDEKMNRYERVKQYEQFEGMVYGQIVEFTNKTSFLRIFLKHKIYSFRSLKNY